VAKDISGHSAPKSGHFVKRHWICL